MRRRLGFSRFYVFVIQLLCAGAWVLVGFVCFLCAGAWVLNGFGKTLVNTLVDARVSVLVKGKRL